MSSTEDSEENVLMLQPPLENSETVLEENELYHSERKRSVYGPKGLGKLIRLNLSGMEYKTWSSTLEHYPDTLLGNAKTRKYFFHDETNEYYFERNRESFPAILYFYQSQGYLERPPSVSLETFVDDIIFFQLDHYALNTRRHGRRDMFQYRFLGKFRKNLWKIMDNEDQSCCGRFMSLLSVIFILISTVSFCLETLPEYDDNYVNKGTDDEPIWVFDESLESKNFKPWNSELKGFPFFIVESICIAFFTLELILRLFSCPSIRTFCMTPLNIVDIVAILPFYTSLLIDIKYVVDENSEKRYSTNHVAFLAVLRIIRILRVVRLAKLSRHSRNLNALIKTITTSVKEFSFLILFFIVSMVIFSTVMYFIERDFNEGFSSIPAACWWCVVTMTTVGYGDVVPISALGKCVGFVCAMTGVICVALPVPSIVQNFHRIYQEDRIKNPIEVADLLKDDPDLVQRLKHRFVHSCINRD